MKIYEKIVIVMSSGAVIDEILFEYNGQIAQCKGGAKIPKQSQGEADLVAHQANLVRQQVKQLRRQNDLIGKLWPKIKKLESGKLDLQSILLSTQKQLAPLQRKLSKTNLETLIGLQPELADAFSYTAGGDEVQNLLRDRYRSSLEGTENISPGLDKQLADEQSAMENQLSQRLGPNWRQTTPGIQAMSELEQRHSLVREEARQGMISTAGSNLLAYTGSRQSGLLGLMGGGIAGGQGSGGGTGGGIGSSGLLVGTDASSVISNLGNQADRLRNERMETFALKQGQQAGQTQAMMGGLLGGAKIGATVGGPAGAVIGGGIGALSGYLLS